MPATYEPLEPPDDGGEPQKTSSSMLHPHIRAASMLQPRKQVVTKLVSTARNVKGINGVAAFLRRSKDKAASLRNGCLPAFEASLSRSGSKQSCSMPQPHGPQPALKSSLERRATDSSPRAIGPSYAPHGSIPTAGTSSRLPTEHASIRPSQSPHPQRAPQGALGTPRVAPQPRSRSCPAAAPRGTLRNTGAPTPVVAGQT